MRIILFFDLPTVTKREVRAYTRFRRELIKLGFFMQQESVYTKLALNPTEAELIKNKLEKIKPKKGLIQLLTITENQYNKMETILGESQTNVVNNVERLIII
nr:CRISPR-associated endonuclease Cas2 [Clostridiales bacterium]